MLELNFDRIFELSVDADDFATMWKSYVESCGWTEDEFERERYRRDFPEDSAS